MSASLRRRGGQLGNSNALKHGFYTRRFHQRDLSGVEETGLKNLAEEIALIRIYTRKLVESVPSSLDIYELVGILRTLCLASTTITRIIKAHAFLTNDSSGWPAELEEAIRQVHEELTSRPDSPPETTTE